MQSTLFRVQLTAGGHCYILHKKVCVDNKNFQPLSEIIFTPIAYKLSEKFFAECPELVSKLQKPTDNALRSNIFERLPENFF